MQCIIKSCELSNEMMAQVTIYKAFTLLLTDDTWRHWQKFNGVCIFRHRVDVKYDMCLWICVNKGDIVCVWVSAWWERGKQERRRTRGHVRSRFPRIHVKDEEGKVWQRLPIQQQRQSCLRKNWLPKRKEKRNKGQDANGRNRINERR